MVILTFGFLGMAQGGGGAVEGFCFFERDGDQRRDEGKVVAIRRFLVELVGLVADGVALAALHGVAVVVEDFLEGAFVNDGLVALEAGALFAFPRLDGDRAEFDALDGLPRGIVAFEDFDAVKAGILEGLEEAFLGVGAADAAAPEVGVVLQVQRDFFVGYDVGNDRASAFFQDTENFREELSLEVGFDEVEHAVGNDDVDAFTGDERVLDAEIGGEGISGEVGIGISDGIVAEFAVEDFQIEREVLDAAFAELDVGVADVSRDDGRVAAGDFQHVIGHVHADDFAGGADDLGGDEADFSCAGAEVEHGFAGPQVLGGIAAAVVFLNDFGGDGLEELRIVLHRAAERGLGFGGGGGVALAGGGFGGRCSRAGHGLLVMMWYYVDEYKLFLT